MFDNCFFRTNKYGTYQTHKNRKQKTLNDFKAGIVKNDSTESLNCSSGDTCFTETVQLLDDAELGEGVLVPKPEDLIKVIEQKLPFVLLKCKCKVFPCTKPC